MSVRDGRQWIISGTLNPFEALSWLWIFEILGQCEGEERVTSCEDLSKLFLAADRHYSSCEYDLSPFHVNVNVIVRSLVPAQRLLLIWSDINLNP
jgi:hypothetical protein